eukprot:SAG31_NODE_2194_length_6224_cov_3.140408_3_plen_152_part_00
MPKDLGERGADGQEPAGVPAQASGLRGLRGPGRGAGHEVDSRISTQPWAAECDLCQLPVRPGELTGTVPAAAAHVLHLHTPGIMTPARISAAVLADEPFVGRWGQLLVRTGGGQPLGGAAQRPWRLQRPAAAAAAAAAAPCFKPADTIVAR